MAYTSEYVQIVIGGDLNSGGSVDQWQIGFKVPIAQNFNTLDPNMKILLDDSVADAQTWWTAIKAIYPASTTLSRVKTNVCTVLGKYKNPNTTFRADFSPVPGTGLAKPLPSEVAYVVTLMTGAARGLGSKGRVYLPAPTIDALSTDGRVDMAAAGSGLRTATGTLVTNLGNVPGADAAIGYGDVSVMSKVRFGGTNKVTGVRTDNLWDTQRRRGNNFIGVVSVVTPVAA